MRKIYLVRHGEPETGTTEVICLGQKDVPLKEESYAFIERLSGYFQRPEICKNLKGIISSPLERCERTANLLWNNIFGDRLTDRTAVSVISVENLKEVDTGIWDGMTFKEIRERFPKEYEERGRALGRYRIPEGETFEEAGIRFKNALTEAVGNSEGDLIVVAHAGVIRAFLCMITGKDINQLTDFRTPYGSITEVRCLKEGEDISWSLEEVGLLPVESMNMETVEDIWRRCEVSEELQNHMFCTAVFAMGQADSLRDFSETDRQILYYSSLLHDILRAKGRGHEKAGADYLWKLGYHELSEPVRMHSDAEVLKEDKPVSPAEVLYYSDKRVKDAEIVSVEDRFAASRKRITDPVGIMKHRERLTTTFAIGNKLRRDSAYRGDFLASICQAMMEENR